MKKLFSTEFKSLFTSIKLYISITIGAALFCIHYSAMSKVGVYYPQSSCFLIHLPQVISHLLLHCFACYPMQTVFAKIIIAVIIDLSCIV